MKRKNVDPPANPHPPKCIFLKVPTDKKNPKPYNFLGPETDREKRDFRMVHWTQVGAFKFVETPGKKLQELNNRGLRTTIVDDHHDAPANINPSFLNENNHHVDLADKIILKIILITRLLRIFTVSFWTQKVVRFRFFFGSE